VDEHEEVLGIAPGVDRRVTPAIVNAISGSIESLDGVGTTR
jgi:hypothetical protein